MEERLLKKRVEELRKRAAFSYQTEFTDFLTLSEIETAKAAAKGANYGFFGGQADVERKMLCIAPEEICITPEMFPICILQILPKNARFAEEFSHRDVLGSVLGLGLERSMIGDIYVKDKEACLFCARRISSFLTEHLTQVRHTQVLCQSVQTGEMVLEKAFQTVFKTVSANRIDAVTAAAFGISRSSAAAAVLAGKVYRNGREVTSPSVIVKEQDVVSFRGFGKAKLKEIGGLTKKGRITITLERYQ